MHLAVFTLAGEKGEGRNTEMFKKPFEVIHYIEFILKFIAISIIWLCSNSTRGWREDTRSNLEILQILVQLIKIFLNRFFRDMKFGRNFC